MKLTAFTASAVLATLAGKLVAGLPFNANGSASYSVGDVNLLNLFVAEFRVNRTRNADIDHAAL